MAGSSGWLEKRKHARVEKSLRIQYLPLDDQDVPSLLSDESFRERTVNILGRSFHPDKIAESKTKDISLGGFALVSEKPLPIGKYLLVEMVLGQSRQASRVVAMVVRITGAENEDPKKYLNGIQIVAIHQDDLNDLQTYIDEKHKNPAS